MIRNLALGLAAAALAVALQGAERRPEVGAEIVSQIEQAKLYAAAAAWFECEEATPTGATAALARVALSLVRAD